MTDERWDVYAPVIITTHCRFEHFKFCIESLSKCTGAENTEIYIGVDYPGTEEHWPGYKKICDYLPSIKGFKNVVIVRRDKNFGALKNALALFDTVHEKYDRYIFSEDDNEFSPNFLEYMNEGLAKFRDNPDVIAVCGYSEPKCSYNCMNSYSYNVFPMKGYNACGVGVWFDKKPEFDSPDRILSSFSTVRRAIKLNHGIAIHRMMFRKRTNAVGDLLWRLYAAFHNKYCVFPTVSKIRNRGFDGSGLNCAVQSSYIKMSIDENKFFKYDDIEIKPYREVNILQKKLYGFSWFYGLAFFFEYLLYRISGGKCFYDFKILRKILKKRISFNNREK